MVNGKRRMSEESVEEPSYYSTLRFSFFILRLKLEFRKLTYKITWLDRGVYNPFLCIVK